MYDIQQLESQWRRYKRKRTAGFVVLVILGLTAAIAGYIFWPNGVAQKTLELNKSEQSPAIPKAPAHVPSAPQTTSLATETPSILEKASGKKGWHMTFADSEKTDTSVDAQTPLQHVDIQVSSKKTEYTVTEIEKRFRFAKDKDDALFLARYYYDKKQYKTALNWALETNKIDSDIEESWLIFGQAKAHLGQRMEAIRVLQAYYDRTGSKRTKKLLDKIRRGKTF
jgi:tetratricopeptide (TPR) repeat protein